VTCISNITVRPVHNTTVIQEGSLILMWCSNKHKHHCTMVIWYDGVKHKKKNFTMLVGVTRENSDLSCTLMLTVLSILDAQLQKINFICSSCTIWKKTSYLACNSMRTELSKSEWWVYFPQQLNHVQVFDSPTMFTTTTKYNCAS